MEQISGIMDLHIPVSQAAPWCHPPLPHFEADFVADPLSEPPYVPTSKNYGRATVLLFLKVM